MTKEQFKAIPKESIKKGLRFYNDKTNKLIEIGNIFHHDFDIERMGYEYKDGRRFENYQEAIDFFGDNLVSKGGNKEVFMHINFDWKYIGTYTLEDFFHQFLDLDSVRLYKK